MPSWRANGRRATFSILRQSFASLPAPPVNCVQIPVTAGENGTGARRIVPLADIVTFR
jgi:hypothetical protein